MTSLNDLRNIEMAFPFTEKMPVLFLGHGSPMNAIEENQFVNGIREIAKTLPKPETIICISAHWYTNGTKVTAMEIPKTIHDFAGFPSQLYEVQYPAKGDPVLANKTKQLLNPALVELDEKWGLDHGTWSVVKHLYPKANVPVIQLSIDYTQSADYHYNLAKRLTSLRNKGVLIIGSGNIIHNLELIDFQNYNKENYGYDWAIEAHEIINTYLMDGNIKALINYRKQGKAVQMAIPTPDHYLPIIYALGLLQKEESITIFNDELVAGSISMTSIKII